MKTTTIKNSVSLQLSNGEQRIFKSSDTIPEIRQKYFLGAIIETEKQIIQVNSLTIS